MKQPEENYLVVSKDDVHTAERLTALEVKEESLRLTVDDHGRVLSNLDYRISALVSEVKGIRNALYIMALAIAANIPALSSLLSVIKSFLVF